MMLTLLSLFFFSSAFSLDDCDHVTHPELAELFHLEKQLDWKAASDADIENAYCTRKTPFTTEEMKHWLNSKKSSLNLTKSINGINFENESPENLESFRLLTSFVDLIGIPVPEKQKTFYSSCKKVDCAVKEIFGNDVGLQLLFMHRRYGMNGSHIIMEESEASKWRKEELDTVLMALSDFPEGVMPIEKSRTLIHAARDRDSGRTIANAVINVFELWNSQSQGQKRSTIVHELGHAISQVTNLDDSQLWMKHSGWTQSTEIRNGRKVINPTASKPETIVSKYGLTNNWEDLAESVVAYRYNPNSLKELSPAKYNLIKKLIFDNVEYTSEVACQSPNRLSSGLKTKAQQKLVSWIPTEAELTQIANRCSDLAVTNLAQNGSFDFNSAESKYCYENSVRVQTTEFLKDEAESDPDFAYLIPVVRNITPPIPDSILKRVSNNTRLNHKKSFTKQLTNFAADTFNCSPQSIQYAYQKFKDDVIGVDTYHHKNNFEKIGSKLCVEQFKGSLNQAISGMLR